MLPGRGLHVDQAPPLDIPFRFFFTAPFFGIMRLTVFRGWHMARKKKQYVNWALLFIIFFLFITTLVVVALDWPTWIIAIAFFISLVMYIWQLYK